MSGSCELPQRWDADHHPFAPLFCPTILHKYMQKRCQPGSALREVSLAGRFKDSRGTVRKALRALSQRLIQDWLGHRTIQHTARYMELSPTRFGIVWR
jgi:integrase